MRRAIPSSAVASRSSFCDRIARPRMRDIVDRVLEAGRGLAAAHAAGVVHRDVKPDNILVGVDGRARVTDFGVAHIGEASIAGGVEGDVQPSAITRTGTLLGTPAYMAPEQLVRGETNAKTDQWSFCATLYEALAAVRPFPVDDLATRTVAITGGRLAPPAAGRSVPAWVKPIVQRGLAAAPERRWPSMAALVLAIERRRHRRRNAAIAIAAAAVIATIALAFAIRPDTRARGSRYPMGAPDQPDTREGCNCPYTACDNGCVGVCRAAGYSVGAPLAGISIAGRQEALIGATLDGESVLYLAGERCSLDHLYLAHKRGAFYVPVDLTPQLDLNRVLLHERCCTLEAHGKGMIVLARDRKSFLHAELHGDTLSAFDGSMFGPLIPEPSEHATVHSPIVTADGLSLYYTINEPSAVPGEAGPLMGIYVATRKDQQSPFEHPRRFKDRVGRHEYVTGVSTDNLTVFATSDFTTFVLSRRSTHDIFDLSKMLYGWRTIPLADCARLLTTWTPSGCAQEDIVFLEGVK
jgi:hypothetical protein